MKYSIVLFAFMLFVSCSKHVTPKRVEKKITEGYWKVLKATSNNEIVTDDFLNYTFSFSKDKSVYITGAIKYSGSWSLSENKNPAVIFINFGGNANVVYFSDDWKIYELSKTDFKMKRNDPVKGNDEIHFRKI